ncbi:MAG: type II toxin-antitoxin system RelE/ParE family toxin [Proteobacteria bacterium]|nr:type II toxin-antitoxin system RelE/ParE family toxin [Pseudomonadota bacterium]
MIVSFRCKHTEMLWRSGKSKRLPPPILKVALRKLWLLDNATDLQDLKAPPSNRLESLCGDRKDQYSIRINNQWRICFVWENQMAHEVEIVDYH